MYSLQIKDITEKQALVLETLKTKHLILNELEPLISTGIQTIYKDSYIYELVYYIKRLNRERDVIVILPEDPYLSYMIGLYDQAKSLILLFPDGLTINLKDKK